MVVVTFYDNHSLIVLLYTALETTSLSNLVIIMITGQRECKDLYNIIVVQ